MKILVINSGSSSLKYQMFDMAREQLMAKGEVQRVGISGSEPATLTQQVPGRDPYKIAADIPDHKIALKLAIATLTDPDQGVLAELSEIGAVGHRVVHGGEAFTHSARIDDRVVRAIQECAGLAPLHNPPNLSGIEACEQIMPDVPQVAVFDTAFHSTLPRHAYLYAIPYEWYEKFRARRYGFHGTSHAYVSQRAAALMGEGDLKIVTCHLGNGSSVAAVDGGRSMDTSMGLTPVEGLVMGTRCGDLDPALVVFLTRWLNADIDQIDQWLNKKSGLLGLSGVGSDMRDILQAASEGCERAEIALEVFCYRVRKYIGAYAAAMGGLDAVVFTAGIGEHSPPVRARACEGLGFLGVAIDPKKNSAGRGERDISAEGARVRTFVVPTNEELVIARETLAIVES
ncbi:MAG: acetate kinase [Armatimonadetes bacterium]|nr:acetate kinase [Armatimonadota bacterium]